MIKQRMFPVCSIETVVSIRPADDQSDGGEFAELVLDCVHGQAGYCRQLANIALFLRRAKEHAQ